MPRHSRALETWREKLDHLLEQEAKEADPNRRFQLEKDITEARAKIVELDDNSKEAVNVARSEPPVRPPVDPPRHGQPNRLKENAGKKKPEPPFVVIGSGNADWLLHGGRVKLGRKNFLSSEQGFGGSGFNCTARLLGAGYPAIPILSTGKDPIGEGIRLALKSFARESPLSDHQLGLFDLPSFFAEGVQTPQSVVMVEGDRRTVFAQMFHVPGGYKQRIDERLFQIVEASEGPPRGVLIGHIHGHGKSADVVREATTSALDRFGEACPVVLNLGASQIDMGVEEWVDPMRRSAVTLMNFHEALKFFAKTDCNTLSQILRWYQKKQIASVITFGRFGAVGCHPMQQSMILAWPYLERHEVVDSTGAGDAMAAGILASLAEHDPSEPGSLQHAMEGGRLWAAYACIFRGAAKVCPSKAKLHAFRTERRDTTRSRSVEVLDFARAEPWLDLIDLAFH